MEQSKIWNRQDYLFAKAATLNKNLIIGSIEDMSEKKLTHAETEKWSEKLGERLHLTYVDVICLQHHLKFAAIESYKDKKFIGIFNYFYRLFFDRLYINIFKLIDKRSDVMSLSNFFSHCGMKENWKSIEDNEIFKKIKSKRHKKLAHEDLTLALNEEKDLMHHKENQLHLSEIESLLSLIKIQFENVLSEIGFPVVHYALGEEKKTDEFRDLLEYIFKRTV